VISEKTAAEQVAQADAQSRCLLNSMLSSRRLAPAFQADVLTRPLTSYRIDPLHPLFQGRSWC
jgi:hypothetical protein